MRKRVIVNFDNLVFDCISFLLSWVPVYIADDYMDIIGNMSRILNHPELLEDLLNDSYDPNGDYSNDKFSKVFINLHFKLL